MFKKKQTKEVLAFGKIPAYCKYELFMERYRSAAEIIRQNLKLTAQSEILDVGCGEGYMKYFFGENEGKWSGIEVWKERAAFCRTQGYTVSEINIDKEKIPYPNAHFDVVIASHVIEHLSDIKAAIQEIARLTKVNGILVIATPTKPPIIASLLNWYYKSPNLKTGETQHAFSANSLRNLVNDTINHNGKWELIDIRGFRIFSARRFLNLENNYWYYKVNTFLSRFLTYLVPEVNLIFKRIE